MRGRLSGPLQNGGESPSGFGLKAASQERAFDLRDPYKLNRAPLLRGGKRGCATALIALAQSCQAQQGLRLCMHPRRVSGLSSYAAVLVAAAVLVGLGVYIGRELVRPERRAWEGRPWICHALKHGLLSILLHSCAARLVLPCCCSSNCRRILPTCSYSFCWLGQGTTSRMSRGTSRRCVLCKQRCAATSSGQATPHLHAQGTSGRMTTSTILAGGPQRC